MSARYQKNKRFAIYTALVFCLLIIIDGASGLLMRLDNQWLDSLVRIHAKSNKPDTDIVVIDIDEDSLHQLNAFAGPWPWPRSVHATLIDLLSKQQPKAIVFDIFFAEPDIERAEADQAFVTALSNVDNVFLPVYDKTDADKNSQQMIRDLPATLNFLKVKNAQPDAKASLIMPNVVPSELWKVGSVNATLDNDGIERRYDIYRAFSGWRLPALPTRLASYLGFKIPDKKEFILDWQRANPIAYPTLPYSQVLVNLTQHVDYPSKNYFAGKIVVIGSTAINNPTTRATPISSEQPSAQILATAIDNLKNNSSLSRPLGSFVNTFIAFLLFIVIFIVFIKTKFNILKTTAWLTAFSAILIVVSYSGASNKTLIPVAGKLFWLWAYFILNLLWQHGHNALHRYRANTLFKRSLSPDALRCLAAGHVGHHHDYAQQQQLTMLCCHIQHFSALTQQHEAKSFVALLNDYLTEQVNIIFKQHGTLDTLTADTLLAFWGAPMPAEKQATTAVNVALEIIDNIDSFKKKHHLPNLQIGIGIHTGLTTVGLIGFDRHLHYAAVGYPIDTVKAIASLAHDKSIIIISTSTQQACADDFKFIDLGNHTLPGEQSPITLFEPKRK